MGREFHELCAPMVGRGKRGHGCSRTILSSRIRDDMSRAASHAQARVSDGWGGAAADRMRDGSHGTQAKSAVPGWVNIGEGARTGGDAVITGGDGPRTGGDDARIDVKSARTGGEGARTGGDAVITGGDGPRTGGDGPRTGGDGPRTGGDDARIDVKSARTGGEGARSGGEAHDHRWERRAHR
jgi:hypothetical protein